MPEGPEIHREADRLAAALHGSLAKEVYFAFPHLEVWQERLGGRRIEGVTAQGKALLVAFEGELFVYTHNQLYGRWFLANPGEHPRTSRSLRFAIHTAKRSALLYSASTIEVLSPEARAAHPFLSSLGPDPLAPDCTFPALSHHIDNAGSRRQLGAMLLDQSFVAGIGNYLRSEILFSAQLLPERTLGSLSTTERRALVKSIWDVTRRAYESGGITRELEEAKRLRRAGLRRREYRHWVFGLAGRPCPRCAQAIVKSSHGGRRIYACSGCQR